MGGEVATGGLISSILQNKNATKLLHHILFINYTLIYLTLNCFTSSHTAAITAYSSPSLTIDLRSLPTIADCRPHPAADAGHYISPPMSATSLSLWMSHISPTLAVPITGASLFHISPPTPATSQTPPATAGQPRDASTSAQTEATDPSRRSLKTTRSSACQIHWILSRKAPDSLDTANRTIGLDLFETDFIFQILAAHPRSDLCKISFSWNRWLMFATFLSLVPDFLLRMITEFDQ
ncbi:hypothetical protein L2E82_10985 [Cichorium intybus]|uniref:Uncharacterized protein n=1 Tax=Cichorium intybus TaxID=13427 RepID=A0ACB9GBV7_CICIN|nr:hypothetical protein L2E82_10985 [Cichorium intybus]